ncbi:MAG: radical SAM protein [Pyrodictiaceae archaeon]
MTLRVLLTLPPGIHDLEIYRITGMKAPPLGLAWIAAVLEKRGHKVKIIDTPTLEIGLEKWLSEVKSWSPDIVGVSMLTPTAPRGYRAIRRLREELGDDIIVIAGGPHPTFMFKEALSNDIDVVVRGEGEYTTLELVETIEAHGLDREALKKVRGIAFKDRDGRIIVTPERPMILNLDELPWPARHLLPMDRYTLFGKPIRVAHILASRGCPYGCIYCITSYFWGRRIRFRSAKNVADEIQHVVEKYKAKYIVFVDDELTAGRKFVYELIGELKKRGLDLPFACGARVDHLTRDYLKFLYDNNCVAVYVGVESASQETLNKIGKKITIEQVKRVFQWKRELGGFMTGSFILGFPWETVDDMKKTVEFAIRLDPDYAQFTALTPYPGTPLFEYASRHGLIEDWNWEHYTTVRPVMRGFYFGLQDLARMLKYAYRKFYLRSAFILRELRAGRLKDLIGVIGKEVASLLKEAIARPLKWGRV